MRMLLSSLLAAQLALAAGCGGEAPVAPDRGGPDGRDAPAVEASLRDGAHGGADGFYFLPPLVDEPNFDGTFDPGRSPTVEICELAEEGCGALIATFTMDTGPGSETVRVDTVAEQYVVNWHTDGFDLEAGKVYRIRVSLEGREAGHADVVAVTSGKEMKNEATDETIALKDGRTLPVKFRIEEELVLEFTVPAVAPDTVPEGFYDESNFRSGSACVTGRMLRGIVVVTFEEGTTQAKKQEAVDLIDGEVVGGIRPRDDIEGYYYIRVEESPGGEILCEAIETLNGLPQVSNATESLTGTAFHRRPDDGGDWREDAWEIAATEVTSVTARWGPEAIAGPLAWGCSTGGDQTPVAVVDEGFQAVPDLMANVDEQWRDDVGVNNTTDHGTNVASVLAARGNNGDGIQGITGTMWTADVRLYDADVMDGEVILEDQGAAQLERTTSRVQEAAGDGALVINLSMGIGWQEAIGRKPGTVADSVDWDLRQADRYRSTLQDALERIPEKPLLVLASGGDGVDAKWAGYPQVKRDFPDRVIVVAASTVGDELTQASNRGELVQIAAPGASVTTLDGVGNPDVVSGTSFAAPYVSGAAGLLASFDPRLTASELKILLLDGAARGDRGDAGGAPILNAHEALKAAGERQGAPLCGNRLWIDDGQIAAQRGDGGPVENLAPVDGEVGALMEALHGGKFLWYGTPSGDRVLEWQLGGGKPTWTSVGLSGLPSDVSELRSGTDASMFGRSHDRDTLVLTDVSETATLWWFEGTGPVEAPLDRFTPSGSDEVASITVRDLPFEHEVICIERLDGGGCTSSILATRTWFFRLSYPQHDRTIFSTVSPVYRTLADSTSWQACSFDTDRECREITLEQKHAGTLVYEVDLESGGVTKVDSLSQMVFWLGQSESRPQQVLGRGTWIASARYGAEQENDTGDPEIERTITLEQCAIEYRQQEGFALDRSITTENACFFTLLNFPDEGGAGTFAPSLVGPSGGTSAVSTGEGTMYVPEVIGPEDVGVKSAP